MFFFKLFNVRVASVLVLLGMLLGLIMSVSFQAFGDYVPCQLCLAQRCLVATVCVLLGVLIYFRSGDLWRWFYIFACIVICFACLTSLYQILVQYDIVSEPGFCKTDSSINGKSVDELINYIKNKQTSSCKLFGPTIFGFPISVYSFFGTLAGLGYMIISYIFYMRKKDTDPDFSTEN